MSSTEQPAETSQPRVSPANDEYQGHLTRTLGLIRAETLAAIRWYEKNKPHTLDRLTRAADVLFSHNIVVSDSLGDAAFKLDGQQFEIQFNRRYLVSIADTVRNRFGAAGFSEAELEELVVSATRLYVFHEVTHVAQNFVEHSLAQTLKDAFGPDELSKFDLVADVHAAHCSTLLALAKRGSFEPAVYLEEYRNNLLLAFEILCHSFSIKDVDHKKKRALGLLTSCVIAELALKASGTQEFDRLADLAIRPAFTSVDLKDGRFVALSCTPTGWQVLFAARVRDDPEAVANVWASLGVAPTEDALAMLLSAFEPVLTEN